MIIQYDNTFEGLLSALYTYYTTPNITIFSSAADNFLLQAQTHQTNLLNAAKIKNKIILKFGNEAFENIYFAFIYNAADKETNIIRYIDSLINKNICYNDAVHKIYSYKRELIHLVNRYHGFLRFFDIGGILYSKYSPQYDITLLLADYFKNRLNGNPYMIHDLKRNNLLLYKDKEHVLIKLKHGIEIDFNKDEKYIQQLYQTYFKSVSIKERENYCLQRTLFPIKFREHAIEFDSFSDKE